MLKTRQIVQFKKQGHTVTRWLSWLKHTPKVAGSMPGQGLYWRQWITVSLSHRCFCFSLSQSFFQIQDHILRWGFKKIIAVLLVLSFFFLFPTLYFSSANYIYIQQVVFLAIQKIKWFIRCHNLLCSNVTI